MAQPASALHPEGAQSKPHITKVAIASLIGTSIEWYDYFLYGTAAALVFNVLHHHGVLADLRRHPC